MTIRVLILNHETVRLPDGREFSGENCETDAARALIVDGTDPKTRAEFVWADGRPSTTGAVLAYAKVRFTEKGAERWRPHERAEVPAILSSVMASVPRRGRGRVRLARAA